MYEDTEHTAAVGQEVGGGACAVAEIAGEGMPGDGALHAQARMPLQTDYPFHRAGMSSTSWLGHRFATNRGTSIPAASHRQFYHRGKMLINSTAQKECT